MIRFQIRDLNGNRQSLCTDKTQSAVKSQQEMWDEFLTGNGISGALCLANRYFQSAETGSSS